MIEDSISLPEEIKGYAEINIFSILSDGTIKREGKIIYVEPKESVDIIIEPDKAEYEPGEEGIVNIKVRKNGKKIRACLGVSIVDSSVFSLLKDALIDEEIYFKGKLFIPGYFISPYYFNKKLTLSKIIRKKRKRITDIIFSEKEQDYRFRSSLKGRKVEHRYSHEFAEKIETKIKKIGERIKDFIENNKEIPDSLLIDPFGDTLEYTVFGNLLFLNSKGIDRIKNTYDDISVSIRFSEEYIAAKGTGIIKGKVIDAVTDEGLPFAVVRIKNTRMGAYTDDRGFYTIYNVPVGVYEITVSYTGYKSLTIKNVIVEKGKTVEVNFALEPTVSEVEPIILEARAKAGAEIPPPDIKIRKYFPETFIFIPSLITDRDGNAKLSLKFPDNITVWKMKTVAITKEGLLNVEYSPIKVFKSFYLDLNIPQILTQGDEVYVPVSIHNNTTQDIKCNIKIETSAEIKVDDDILKTAVVKSKEIKTVYFKIKAIKSGLGIIRVYAWNGKEKDAIEKKIKIRFYGKEEKFIKSGMIKAGEGKSIDVDIKSDNIEYFYFKIYKNNLGLTIKAFESLLIKPHGCFEQVSSILYPEILIFNIIKKQKIKDENLKRKISEYISLGYQKILKYEVKGGGFSWYGKKPADLFLTAYGLMELNDLKKVFPVDEYLIDRTVRWLLSQQNRDGSWTSMRKFHFLKNKKYSKILTTAYVLWALIEAGTKDRKIKKGIRFLKENINDVKDPYVLGILLNCFASYNPESEETKRIASLVVKLGKYSEKGIFWDSGIPSFTYSTGYFRKMETVSLIGLGLLKANLYKEVVFNSIRFILNNKKYENTWGTTQSTVLILKLLNECYNDFFSVPKGYTEIVVNNKKIKTFDLSEIKNNVIVFDIKKYLNKAKNNINIKFKGKGYIIYEFAGKYYKNWRAVRERESSIALDIKYTKLRKGSNKYVRVKCSVKNLNSNPFYFGILEVGLPPGFYVSKSEFQKLMGSKSVIKNFEIRKDRIILYLKNLEPYEASRFSFNIYPKFKMKVKTFPSFIYEYYSPDNFAFVRPVVLKTD